MIINCIKDSVGSSPPKTYVILHYNYSEHDYTTDIILYNIVTRIGSMYIGENGYIKWCP